MKSSAILWLLHDLARAKRLLRQERQVRRLRLLRLWWRENVRGRYLGEV